jgi:HEAT repeat protein
MTREENNATPDSIARAAAIAAVTLSAAELAAGAEAEDKFLAGIRSDDEDANHAAWSTADEVDPSVIPALSELLRSNKPNVRKAAEEALKHIVHSVGKRIDPRSLGANTGRPDDPGRMDLRQQVVMHLVALLDGKRPKIEKTTALRHLSLIASTDDVGKIATLIHDPQLREEAAFCLERIPGKASEEALLGALPAAANDFKPRILAALGHRRADEAVAVCIEAMESPDTTIAMAGMKAWARIGSATGSDVAIPELDSLSEWQKIEFDDSMLRFADAQLEKGNTREAMEIYLRNLDRDEEHLQCAAIIGLAKIGSPRTAAAIFPKLRSENNTVMRTARQAWSMLGSGEGSG